MKEYKKMKPNQELQAQCYVKKYNVTVYKNQISH